MSAVRPQARRRGGARALTLGYLSVGGSSFVLLAAGPRLLDTVVFSGLGLVWTTANLFGLGIGAPTEQAITRRMNAGVPRAWHAPLRSLFLLGLAGVLVCLVIIPHSAAAQRLPVMTVAILIAIGGWVWLAPVRGRLAGSGDLVGYTVTLFVESGARVVFVGLALIVPYAPVLLSLAVGLPLWAAAVAGASVRIPSVGLIAYEDPAGQAGPVGVLTGSGSGEYGAFLVVLLGYQVCLNSAPLLMEWRFGHAQPAAVGAFVAASTYFRIPILLVGGILTHALVEMSHAWGEGDPARFRQRRRVGMRRLLLTVIGISAVLALGAPVLLRAYYGAPLGLPLAVLLALPASTVVAQTAVMVVQGLLATDRGMTAAVLWAVGGGVTVSFLSSSHGLDVWVEAGLVLGPVVVLIGGLLAERSRYSDTGPADRWTRPLVGDRAGCIARK